MKKTIIYTLFLIFSSCTLSNQNKEEIINKMIDEVTYLASDELEGRETGTDSEKLAADYISSKFNEYNLIEKGTQGYLQYFNATIKENPHTQTIKKKIKGINVVGYIDNSQDETVIIGAHYDHLGYGHFGSLYDGEKEVHNGADDNASGVSIMINLAKTLNKIKEYNYLFIAFSGEEHGLFGSSFYAKNPTIDLKDVRFMINFDMVGRLNEDKTLAINGIGTSSYWDELINDANIYNFKLKTTESGIGPSDHTSFYLQDIPSIHFFTGQHEDYHKPSDDVEKINFEGMFEIYNYVKNIISSSTKIENFDFVQTKSDSTTTPRFNVTLGVMPDYLFDGEGMRIDGISKGKTAEKFDILKGDIVIKIGDVEVPDMIGYMEGLSKFEKGDSAVVKIKRGEEIISKSIVFQ
ncbi:MAG: M28 family peptidase [Flavobacteriales bacterium]|nr:M28 family peptidase [Flavobacteriales bacterium]